MILKITGNKLVTKVSLLGGVGCLAEKLRSGRDINLDSERLDDYEDVQLIIYYLRITIAEFQVI